MKLLCLLITMCLLACTPSIAHAQTSSPRPLPAWEQLSQAQRDELTAPIRERWNRVPAERARMLERARRWHAMPPDQRARAHHGMQRFERMDSDKRKHAHAMFETMRNLPEAERRALRERLKKMTPEERRAWMRENHPSSK